MAYTLHVDVSALALKMKKSELGTASIANKVIKVKIEDLN